MDLINTFFETGKEDDLFSVLKYCRTNNLFNLGILFGEFFNSFYNSYRLDDELGMCYYYGGYYGASWAIYNQALSKYTLEQFQAELLVFNAHFNIPYIEELALVPLENILKDPFSLNKCISPLITFTITTCKRLDLFEKTMISFLNCCADVHLIYEWICIDDNSSKSDREAMKRQFPFMKFIFKTEAEKGHAESMNKLLQVVKTPYIFHLEDDWLFYHRQPFISNCLRVLHNDTSLGQCLINRNYAEINEDVSIKGGEFKSLGNLRYYIHEFEADNDKFSLKYGNVRNCSYWPHYSLRAGLTRTSVYENVGPFNPSASHFEMDFAYRYMEKGYKTAFLENISCKHIGRLTKDRYDNSKINAYSLNKTPQFGNVPAQIVVQTHVISLERRRDRLEKFAQMLQEKQINMEFVVFDAIDGKKLKSTRRLEQLFRPNDYNYRRGLIGCALSHISIWTKMLNTDKHFDFALIMEDDVVLVDDFADKLRKFHYGLKSNWEIVFLGHHPYEKFITSDTFDKTRVPKVVQYNALKSITESKGGTGGYIINVRGARKMLSFIQKFGMMNGIDTMMQKACDDLVVYYADTHLFTAPCAPMDGEKVDSDIQYDYDSIRVSKKEQIQHEIEFVESNGHKDKIRLCPDKLCEHEELRIEIEDSVLHISDSIKTFYMNNYRLMKHGDYCLDDMIAYV